MTNDEEDQKVIATLPVDLPKCKCFDVNHEGNSADYVMTQCADVATACHTLVDAFYTLAETRGLCKTALPYFVEMFLVTTLTGIAKINGPALEYGSQEIEWEFEALLKGIEARVLMRSRDVYARSRALGLTEEKMRAMHEARRETQQ